jgi:transglutaminase-like putative cysteine protease
VDGVFGGQSWPVAPLYPGPCMKIRFVLLATGSLLVLSPDLHALQAPPEISSIVSASQGVTPERFPNADTVVLENIQRVEVNAEGGAVRKSLSRTKAITEKGRRDLLTYSTSFNTDYGYAKVIALRIIKPDGSVVTLDPAKQSAIQQDPSSGSMNIYDPAEKMLVASIPGVQLGDIVEVETDEGEPKARMKGGFSDITTLEDDVPVLRRSYTVVTPKSLPLARIVIKDGDDSGLGFTKTEKGDTIEYAWEIGETPQIIPEPGMPSSYLCVRRLLVSTIPDWETVSRWYWDISEPHFKITDEIRAKAEELVKGIDDREQRIRAIYKFVSQEIRYMGITTETEAPGYEPHDVSLTFSKRYGVCRDKAALLAVMLRAAGFDAYPVLIMSGGGHLDQEVAMPYFNHAITAVRDADGTVRLMDSTDESTKDIFPAYLANCSYLVADPKGDTLRVSAVPDAAGHMLVAETNLSVRKDGSVAGETAIDFGGANDTTYRAWFGEAKADDIHRALQRLLAAVVPGLELEDVKLEPESLKDTSQPMKLRVRYTAPDFFVDRDGKALLRTPFLSQALGMVTRQLAGVTTLEKRRFPIKLDMIAGVKERVTITLPESIGATLALPADKTIDDANLSFSQTTQRDGDRLVGEFDLRMKRLDIPAADYDALRTDLREISRAGRRNALVSTDSGVKPDLQVQRRKATVTIADAHSYSVRTEERSRVLTYAGKKANAELKLSWNSANPEPVLERATVTDKDGILHEVAENEINVLDADWVASAPRYAPSRTKVISLPKVEEGSLIDYAYTETYQNLIAVSWSEIFASTDAVDADEIEIIAPATLQLHVDNRAGAKITKEGDKQHITVKRRLLPIAREAGLAPAETWAPQLAFTTMRDDAAYAEAMRPVIEAKCMPDDAVKSKAAELVAGLPSDADKIVALRDFVARNIREAGPGWGEIPVSQLSGAAPTLADGYGGSADRQLLFVALLRAAGYDATPALFATDQLAVVTRRPSEALPQGYYTTLGTRLRLPDGPIDFTYLSQYADWHVNAGDGDVILPLDSGKPERVKSTANRATTSYSIVIADSGDATVDYSSVVSGENATSFTGWAAEATPEDISRRFQSLITGLSRDAALRGEPVIEKGAVGKLGYGASVADFAVVQGDLAYFDLPGGAGEIFGGANETDRRLPYALGSERSSRAVWTVDLPKGWKLAGEPRTIDWDGPSDLGNVTLSVTTETRDDGGLRLVWTRDIALKAAVVSPEAFPALVELNRRMKAADTWRVLLERE